MVQLIAHRGNAREFPENTLPAFRSALELGVNLFELDVQLAADGVPVVIHDHQLMRTADLPGAVFDHPAAELARIQVNERSRLSDRFNDVRIPLLTDVVSLLEERQQATAFVEIKRASLRRFGNEAVVASVLDMLRPVRERAVVISFDLQAVYLARAGGHGAGWVISDYGEHTRLKCEALKPEYLFCDHQLLSSDASKLWRGPWKWAVYEVDRPHLALELHDRGAEFIETMAVASMLAGLQAMRA